MNSLVLSPANLMFNHFLLPSMKGTVGWTQSRTGQEPRTWPSHFLKVVSIELPMRCLVSFMVVGWNDRDSPLYHKRWKYASRLHSAIGTFKKHQRR